jgi:hypothetical protein
MAGPVVQHWIRNKEEGTVSTLPSRNTHQLFLDKGGNA